MHFAFTSQTWIFSLHSSIYVNKSVCNDDDQSDGDEDGDLLAMMWTMTFFGLCRIVTNAFRIASLKKYLHNTALYMFPFASDASV